MYSNTVAYRTRCAYNGGQCRTLVEVFRGLLSFKIPRACPGTRDRGGGASDEENTYRAYVLVHDLLKGGPDVTWMGATEGGEGGAPFTDALKGLRT